jgi:hypothetical protein
MTPVNITYDPCKYYLGPMQISLRTPANITYDPCKYYLIPLQILLRTPANITRTLLLGVLGMAGRIMALALVHGTSTVRHVRLLKKIFPWMQRTAWTSQPTNNECMHGMNSNE